MKRSYDYFKTLKRMADYVSISYSAVCKSDDCQKNTIFFHSAKSELTERLSDEFVAPIERNDIYNLSSSLYREFNMLCKIGNLCHDEQFDFTNVGVETVLNSRLDLIGNLSDKRTFTNLLCDVTEQRRQLYRIKKGYIARIPTIFDCDGHTLWRYAVADNVVRFIECVDDTFGELERAVINNS